MAGLQVAFRVFAIHLLPITGYGKTALLLSLFNGLLILGHAGVPTATARLAATNGIGSDRTIIAGAAKAAAVPASIAAAVMFLATYVVTDSVGLGLLAGVGTPPMVASVVASGFLRGKGAVWAAASIQPLNAAVQLAAFALVAYTSAHVGIGWTLGAFYLGNAGACFVAAFFLFRSIHRAPRSSNQLAEAAPRRILAMSVWLSLATAGASCAPIVARVGLVHFSYAQVAFFDLALLIYSVPQRFRASMTMALIPLAARMRVGAKLMMPAVTDIALLLFAVAIVDAAFWQTHAVRHLLESLGLARYGATERYLLILILGAPGELLYGLNAGLLAAAGRSKDLARVSWSVLVPLLVLMPLVLWLGPVFVAGLLAVEFWALYWVSRRVLGTEVVAERRLVSLPRLRHAWDLRTWRAKEHLESEL